MFPFSLHCTYQLLYNNLTKFYLLWNNYGYPLWNNNGYVLQLSITNFLSILFFIRLIDNWAHSLPWTFLTISELAFVMRQLFEFLYHFLRELFCIIKVNDKSLNILLIAYVYLHLNITFAINSCPLITLYINYLYEMSNKRLI